MTSSERKSDVQERSDVQGGSDVNNVQVIETSTVVKVVTRANKETIVPRYKWIDGTQYNNLLPLILSETPFTVDAFRYGKIDGCLGYFLSHFHSDHYAGLSGSSFARYGAPLYCSGVTANLVISQLGVPSDLVFRLPIDGQFQRINDAVQVALVDANHCPGSAMFLFLIDERRLVLHTGDFRASPALIERLILSFKANNLRLETIFLDTTYADPRYSFPPQERVIAECCKYIEMLVDSVTGRQMLLVPIRRVVLVGTYLIGKERIALALAKALGSKIYADARKRRIIHALDWPELWESLTEDPLVATVHLVAMSVLSNDQTISAYLDLYHPTFTHAVAIKPTGWTFKEGSGSPFGILSITNHPYRPARSTRSTISNSPPKKALRPNGIIICAVPYSEHSSYSELCAFLKAIPAPTIIPTVGPSTGRRIQFGRFEWDSHRFLSSLSLRRDE